MNIFKREIKAHYKGLIGWSIGMIILVASGMAKFTSLYGDSQTATDLFKTFPKPVMAILGIQGLDLGTVIGYFGVLFLYIALMAAIHAAMIGAEVVFKEERDRTSEFLYPKPVSRMRVMTEKLIAAFTNVVILNIVTVVSSVLMVAAFAKDGSNNATILVLMTGLFLMQLIFLALGAAMAGIFKNPKLPSIAATSTLLVTYIIWVVVDLNSNLNNLKYLTPFEYFDASTIIKNGNLDPFYTVLSLIIIVVLITTSYFSFNKRDLKV